MAERVKSFAECNNCQAKYRYDLFHSGFGDMSYAYCDSCGRAALLSYWDKQFPKISLAGRAHQVITQELEEYLAPCECGGAFKANATPRCPSCMQPLSAQAVTEVIESNAPGTKQGWRWQQNWTGLYVFVVEDKKELHPWRRGERL
jgi:hypothetical protein